MTKNILVVDDSFIMRTIIKDIVESDPDLKVVGMAENGKIGLQKARELKPDLILLDIEMPEMTGIEMLQRLMLVGKIKVIIISSVGQVGSPQALQARKLGALDVIPKPSGAMSLDLQEKKGHEIVQAARRALSLDAAAS
ncbi:response regulator [Lacibacterium aquatile]|uniref:Response regulator n=1 Tax=Lacibacterium aquatile TaxID=1168082 RepID=A0ABW5DJU4_9PROT